jgi:DNA-binding response OmpR family regulator
VFGTAEGCARLAEQGQAGGDLSFVRLGAIDSAQAPTRAAECAVVVTLCDAAEERSLTRTCEALARLPVPCLALVENSRPGVLVSLLAAGAGEALPASLTPREIVAHLRALLRRPAATTQASPGPLAAGQLVLDRDRYEATVSGCVLDLTPREFSLLAYLLEHAGRACRREELAREVWAGEVTGRSRTIDVHVGRLRAKLAGSGVRVTTLAAVGYRLEEG